LSFGSASSGFTEPPSAALDASASTTRPPATVDPHLADGAPAAIGRAIDIDDDRSADRLDSSPITLHVHRPLPARDAHAPQQVHRPPQAHRPDLGLAPQHEHAPLLILRPSAGHRDGQRGGETAVLRPLSAPPAAAATPNVERLAEHALSSGCTIGAASSRMMAMIEVANASMQRDGW
jgi:hypothetical protein